MSIVWASDLHAGFLEDKQLTKFCESIANTPGLESVLIGGDISEARKLTSDLNTVRRYIKVPIYFVLGNHDYYGSSIKEMSNIAKHYCRSNDNIWWLDDQQGAIDLGNGIGLMGVGGWGDCTVGNPDSRAVALNDWHYIEELSYLTHTSRVGVLKDLGKKAAEHTALLLSKAVCKFDKIVFLTHVPPWPEVSFHRGVRSDDNYLPYYCCAQVGKVICGIMKEYPEKSLLSLSGHTHGGGEAAITDNILALSSSSEYKMPEFTNICTFLTGGKDEVA